MNGFNSMDDPSDYLSYIKHHGIKGQKWGVRNYQNPDGSLTTAGRIHYGYGEGSTIAKGTTIKRFANSGEKIDDRRKYVSFNRDDYDQYRIDAAYDTLWADKNKSLSEYTYTAKKDIRMADSQKVFNDLVETYGDEKIKDIVARESEDSEDQQELFQFVKDTMNVKMDEIWDKYSDEGYDAIGDVEDWMGEGRNSAIILKPMDSLELQSEEALKRENRILYEHQAETNKTKEEADSIFNTLTDDEKEKLGEDPSHKEWLSEKDSQSVAKRTVTRNANGEAMSVADAYADYENRGVGIAVMTKNSEDARGKGYATTAIKDLEDWFDTEGKNDFDQMVYWVRSDNDASIKVAEKSGFTRDHTESDGDYDWIEYLYKGASK